MNYIKQVLFTLIIIAGSCISPDSSGQIFQSKRFEQEHKNRDENFTVIPLKEDGIALLRPRNKYNGNKKLWEVIILDSALQEKKIIEFYLEERYPLIGYEISSRHLYFLFRTGDTNKNSFELFEFDRVEGVQSNRFDIKPEVEFKITHFSKVGGSMVFGGYVSNDPAVLLFDPGSGSIKVVPGFFQDDNELVDLRVNENKTFNVILIDRSQRSDRKLVFKTFDEQGKLLLDDVVDIDDERSLQTSISSTLMREDMVVLGTWGDRLGKQSMGFFAMPVDPFGDQKIAYYHFGEMEHFTDYLSPKRAERIKEKTVNDVTSGRKPSFTAHVLPFKVEETTEGFIMLAEVYNPVTTSNPYYNSPYGSPYYNPYYFYNPFWPYYYPGMRYRPYNYGNSNRNTEEIKTYETVLVSFDGKGKLLWDQSIKLDDVERPALEQVADFIYSDAKVHFFYKKDSELKIRTIDLAENVKSDTTQKIMLNDPADEIRDERKDEGGVQKWFGNNFFIWGYQSIRNRDRKEDRIRDVFYINKVAIR